VPGACFEAVGALLPSDMSPVCSALVMSDRTQCSSSRLVGGVEMDGDALIMIRVLACFSVRTVMSNGVDVNGGEVPCAVLAGGPRGLVASDCRVDATERRDGGGDDDNPWRSRSNTLPRCGKATFFTTWNDANETYKYNFKAELEGDEAPCSGVSRCGGQEVWEISTSRCVIHKLVRLTL
jgi:hypothetical protein